MVQEGGGDHGAAEGRRHRKTDVQLDAGLGPNATKRSSSRSKSAPLRKSGQASELPPLPPPSFHVRTMRRLAEHGRQRRAAQREERRRAKSESSRFAHVDTQAFLRETQMRLYQEQAARRQLEPGTRPAKVAIIGAGPVGLWIAVLLAREHATIVHTPGSSPRIGQLPGAPRIDVFEARTRDTGYGSRRIVLAISTATQDLLNSNLVSSDAPTSRHVFSPTCSINDIEAALLDNFERYCAAGFGELRYGAAAADPETILHEHQYDAVIVASGRRALASEWRVPRGLAVTVSNTEEALILKYTGAQDGKRPRLERGLLAATAGIGGGLRVFLRPGTTADSGYVWFLGVPCGHQLRERSATPATSASFGEAWASLAPDVGSLPGREHGDPCEAAFDDAPAPAEQRAAPGDWVRAAMRVLDEVLTPKEVSARVTEASYWHSSAIAYRCGAAGGSAVSVSDKMSGATDEEHDGDGPGSDSSGARATSSGGSSGGGWIVLAGDAACGRPFHLGSTLNGHLHDVVLLARYPPWAKWDPEGNPFRRYLSRYSARTAAAGFRSGT